MEEITNLMIKNAYIPVVITAGYALLVFRKLPFPLKVLSIFIFLSAVVQISSAILWLQKENNLPILHFYVGLGFLSLSWFYNSILKGFINKWIIPITALLFAIFTIVNATLVQGLATYASNSLVVESILIIILSLSTFILLLDNIVKKSKAPIVTSLNWINSGLFLYYSSSLLLFYFGKIITHEFSKALNLYTWVLHLFFMTIMYLCFFIGLWKRPRN